ncbi:hypothetical protein LFM09_47880 [Lentzea alba]|uniref:hypothetical protein n=1 Tax=Lentzea alba TaxID=2714351 RepID=UPI0039BF25A8
MSSKDGRRATALPLAAIGCVLTVLAVVLHPAERPPRGTFDPLVRTISAGSAGGFRPETYITGRYKQSIMLTPERNGDQSASVAVHAKNTIGVLPGEKMPDVNGRRALWTGDYLSVEWEPDAWAFIDVQGFPDDRSRAVAIAANLRFDEHLPIEVPYTVQTSWELDSVSYTEGDVVLVFTNNVRLALRAGTGLATGPAPEAELDALERSVRPADPPVTNPFR